MKALAIEKFGGVDVATIMDLPRPEPGPGEVLVELQAAALNHLDLWSVQGIGGSAVHFPHVLGADGAGTIAEVGEGVSGLRPGAPVIINPGISCGGCEFCRAGEQSMCATFRMLGEHDHGTFAEFVKVPAANVFPYPDHLSPSEAAALGVTSITAYRMLFTRGRLKPGEWVLITGIGGGLALSLLQLARPIAGRIFVTSSSDDKLARAADLGADEGINYRSVDTGKAVRSVTGKRGVDLVVDSAGGPSLEGAFRALCKGGRLVTSGATAGPASEIDLRRIFWNQLELIGSTMGSHSDVANMLRMVTGTRLRPIIDRTFALQDGPDALAYLESQQHFGKIVLEIA